MSEIIQWNDQYGGGGWGKGKLSVTLSIKYPLLWIFFFVILLFPPSNEIQLLPCTCSRTCAHEFCSHKKHLRHNTSVNSEMDHIIIIKAWSRLWQTAYYLYIDQLLVGSSRMQINNWSREAAFWPRKSELRFIALSSQWPTPTVGKKIKNWKAFIPKKKKKKYFFTTSFFPD